MTETLPPVVGGDSHGNLRQETQIPPRSPTTDDTTTTPVPNPEAPAVDLQIHSPCAISSPETREIEPALGSVPAPAATSEEVAEELESAVRQHPSATRHPQDQQIKAAAMAILPDLAQEIQLQTRVKLPRRGSGLEGSNAVEGEDPLVLDLIQRYNYQEILQDPPAVCSFMETSTQGTRVMEQEKAKFTSTEKGKRVESETAPHQQSNQFKTSTMSSSADHRKIYHGECSTTGERGSLHYSSFPQGWQRQSSPTAPTARTELDPQIDEQGFQKVKPTYWWRHSRGNSQLQQPEETEQRRQRYLAHVSKCHEDSPPFKWRRESVHPRWSSIAHKSENSDQRRRQYLQRMKGLCFNCFSNQHQVRFCYEPTRCFRCMKSGHVARRCPNRKPRSEFVPGYGVTAPIKHLHAQGSSGELSGMWQHHGFSAPGCSPPHRNSRMHSDSSFTTARGNDHNLNKKKMNKHVTFATPLFQVCNEEVPTSFNDNNFLFQSHPPTVGQSIFSCDPMLFESRISCPPATIQRSPPSSPSMHTGAKILEMLEAAVDREWTSPSVDVVVAVENDMVVVTKGIPQCTQVAKEFAGTQSSLDCGFGTKLTTMMDDVAVTDELVPTKSHSDVEAVIVDVSTQHDDNPLASDGDIGSPVHVEETEPEATKPEMRVDYNNSVTTATSRENAELLGSDLFLINITTPMPAPVLAAQPILEEDHTTLHLQTPLHNANKLPANNTDFGQTHIGQLVDKANGQHTEVLQASTDISNTEPPTAQRKRTLVEGSSGMIQQVSPVEVANRKGDGINDLAEFLDFISCAPPAPLLHTPPRVNNVQSAEAHLDNKEDTNTETSTAQRKSTRLADKAKLNPVKGSIQLAQRVLVNKLGELSPNLQQKVGADFNSLAQHLPQPLTKSAMEAIQTYVEQGNKPKSKKRSKVTPAPTRN